VKTPVASINGGTIAADVAVVGAGPAGLTVAKELAQAGLDVVLVESGTERRQSPANRLNRGTSGSYLFPLSNSRNRAFGGTSALWRGTTGLRVRPLDAMDMQHNCVSGAPGWPLLLEDLQRYYNDALRDLGLACTSEPSEWRLPGSGTLAPFARMFLFGPHDHFVGMRDYIEQSPKVNLVLDATATSIETTSDGGQVVRLRARSLAGSAFSIRARRFVLASGGIENARILLASRGVRPNGVANHNDMVGRFFMDHLSQDVAYVTRPSDAVSVSVFEEHVDGRGRKAQAMFGLPFDEIRERRLMNAAMWIAPVTAAEMSPGVRAARSLRYSLRARPLDKSLLRRTATAARDPKSLLEYARRKTSNRAPDALAFRIMAEQAPNRDSRVTLGSRTDELGMPRTKLDWKISDVDRASIQSHIEGLKRTVRDLGLGSVRIANDLEELPLVANHHHLGTTRMHADSKLGVVDAHCQAHEVPNLFLAGSSVFPSGGYVNPTLTILALARRLAERIANDMSPAVLSSQTVQRAAEIRG
jgi:choline dehydrogenase-like flavoprotein